MAAIKVVTVHMQSGKIMPQAGMTMDAQIICGCCGACCPNAEGHDVGLLTGYIDEYSHAR
jgi:hypothetical protein